MYTKYYIPLILSNSGKPHKAANIKKDCNDFEVHSNSTLKSIKPCACTKNANHPKGIQKLHPAVIRQV